MHEYIACNDNRVNDDIDTNNDDIDATDDVYGTNTNVTNTNDPADVAGVQSSPVSL